MPKIAKEITVLLKLDIKKVLPVFVGFLIGLILGCTFSLVSIWFKPSNQSLEDLPSYEVIQEIKP